MREATFHAKNPFFISFLPSVRHSPVLLQKQGRSLWKETPAGLTNVSGVAREGVY